MSSDDVTMKAWDEKHLRAATRAAGVALWSWNVDTDAITMDESALRPLGGFEGRTGNHFRGPVPEYPSRRSLRGSGRHLPPPAQSSALTRLIFAFWPEATFAGFPLAARVTMRT